MLTSFINKITINSKFKFGNKKLIHNLIIKYYFYTKNIKMCKNVK